MVETSKPHSRRSIRLPGHDYSQPGNYFITIDTHGHKCLFGKISDGKMCLSPLGQIVYDCWQEIPFHFSNSELGEFIIMPNHVHGIIQLTDETCMGTIYRAHTEIHEKFGKPVVGSIPTIIRTYKAAVSRISGRTMGYKHIWHRNYWEHIITNDREYESIVAYIACNAENWSSDPDFS